MFFSTSVLKSAYKLATRPSKNFPFLLFLSFISVFQI